MKNISKILLLTLLSLSSLNGNKNEKNQRYIFPDRPPTSFIKDISSIVPNAQYTLSALFGATIINAGLTTCTETPCSKQATVQVVVGSLAISYGLLGYAQNLLPKQKLKK